MAWLAGWSYRKSKTITGSTVGPQEYYQMRLTIYKDSNPDTSTTIHTLNINDDFSDIRFTDSGGINLLDYWIESITPGIKAVIWVKIPSIPIGPGTVIIYVYYGKSPAVSLSNASALDATFEGYAKNDGQGVLSVTPSAQYPSAKLTVTNQNWIGNLSLIYKVLSVPFPEGYELRFHYQFTSNDGGAGTALIGLSDSIPIASYGDTTGPATTVFIPVNWNVGGVLYLAKYVADSVATIIAASGARDTATYGRIRRSGNQVVIESFSDPEFTNLVGKPGFTESTITTYPVIVAGYKAKNTNTANHYTSGWIENVHARRYVDPEPSFSATGVEGLSPGNLDISSTPPGASIYIDDVLQPGVLTPATITDLAPGSHTYKLVLTGYNDITGSFTIISAQTTIVSQAMIQSLGNLAISSTPSGATIYIDDVLQPGIITPYIITDLTPGSHTYKLTKADYYDATGTFNITGGQITTVSVIMAASECPSTPRYSGNTVHLRATPRDGIGPYYVEFRKRTDVIAYYNNAPENVDVTYDYLLTDEDVVASSGTIDFSVYIEDSCPTGAKTCTQTCTVNIGCLAPVCNFTVT